MSDMSVRRDPDAVVTAWLDEGPTDLPGETRRAIIVALPTTPQARRGRFAPWRPSMTGYARLAAVIAVMAIAGATAVAVLRPGSGTGGPVASATPSPLLEASPEPTALPSPPVLRTTAFQIPLSITVPPSWTAVKEGANYFVVYRPTADGVSPLVGIDVILVDNVYADLCDPEAGMREPPLGPSVDDLTQFLLTAELLRATTADPSVTVDGLSGSAVDEAFVSSGNCQGGMVLFPLGPEPYIVFETERKQMWVVGDGTRRLMISIVIQDESWTLLYEQALAALQTIRFE